MFNAFLGAVAPLLFTFYLIAKFLVSELLVNCDGIFLNYTWKTPQSSEPPKDREVQYSLVAVAPL